MVSGVGKELVCILGSGWCGVEEVANSWEYVCL